MVSGAKAKPKPRRNGAPPGGELTWDKVLYIGDVDHPKAYVVPAKEYERLLRAADKLRRLQREMRAAKTGIAPPARTRAR